jgi:deoxyribonuclease-4
VTRRRSEPPRLGAHLSIAGGVWRAVDRAEASGCAALQIFTKSAGQWRARPLPADEVVRFRERVGETGIRPVLAHNSYLINVAAASPALREQSAAALEEEIDRAELLGLDGLVMHPG